MIKEFNKRFPKIKVVMVRAPGGQLITECASTATAASAATPLAVTGHAR